MTLSKFYTANNRARTAVRASRPLQILLIAGAIVLSIGVTRLIMGPFPGVQMPAGQYSEASATKFTPITPVSISNPFQTVAPAGTAPQGSASK